MINRYEFENHLVFYSIKSSTCWWLCRKAKSEFP